MIKLTATIAVLVLALAVSVYETQGDTSPADAFDGERAWWVDSVLCAPVFEGRLGATKGGRAAEDWIASRFAEYGLLPGSSEGTYFQEFQIIGFHEKKTSLDLLDSPFGKIKLVHGDDYTLFLTPAAGKVTAEAVLIGYGIDAPDKGRDDYGDIDLRGKIAIILRGSPSDGQNWDDEYSRNHTFPAAVAHGAAAVFYYQREKAVSGAALSRDAYDPDVPGGYISKRLVDLLLRESGWQLEEIREKLKTEPFPLPTGKRLRFKVSVTGEQAGTARNVLGMMRGSDPRLGTEVVLFGAHHDHLGYNANEHLYAGANDNASGTAVVLELARALSETDWQPKRTVYFVTFGAEEMGLVGSRHMAEHLPFDSTKIVMMVNLDMAGHGDGGFGLAGGRRVGAPYFAWRAVLDSTRAAQLEEYRLGGGYSDYAPFAERGIPALSSWSRGDHHRYHDFEDLPHFVLPSNLQAVGRGVGSLIVHVADWPSPLADGFGHERALRSQAMQIIFDPIDVMQVSEPERSLLEGAGRIAGRIVALDTGNAGAEEFLDRLGKLSEFDGKYPWLDVTKDLPGIWDAWNDMHVGLLPVIGTPALDEWKRTATSALCAAGLAGAYWPVDTDPPAAATCEALTASDRFLIVDASSDWHTIRERDQDLRILLRRTGGDTMPAPPDSILRKNTILVLSVEGETDSTWIREALKWWGDDGVHLDIADGLEADVDDVESLRFIRWLRDEGLDDEAIEAILGHNLREL